MPRPVHLTKDVPKVHCPIQPLHSVHLLILRCAVLQVVMLRESLEGGINVQDNPCKVSARL